MSSLPRVSVVIPAHKRPELLRKAIRSAREQDYEGDLDVIVVFDRADPDMTLEDDGPRPVRVLRNSRADGLAGARNTGILAAGGSLIAFCDDDDYWVPQKVRRQVAVMQQHPNAVLVSCSIVVEYSDRSTVRKAGTDSVTHEMLVRSRMAMLHSSTFLFRKASLQTELGLINEDIPGSQNEDWDILLRASSLAPIPHIDDPLVHVLWGRASFFSRQWDTKVASSIWMLDHHDGVATDSRGASRLMGQIAFAHACNGQRTAAWKWAARSLRRNPLQWRSIVSVGVACAPRTGEVVLSTLHRWGRGV